ncbi:MAG: hypothetical protein ACYTE5_00535 [Planctomycetota bacterium]|jgi:hypothetical protein
MPLTVSGAVVISEARKNVKENLKGEIMRGGNKFGKTGKKSLTKGMDVDIMRREFGG